MVKINIPIEEKKKDPNIMGYAQDILARSLKKPEEKPVRKTTLEDIFVGGKTDEKPGGFFGGGGIVGGLQEMGRYISTPEGMRTAALFSPNDKASALFTLAEEREKQRLADTERQYESEARRQQIASAIYGKERGIEATAEEAEKTREHQVNLEGIKQDHAMALQAAKTQVEKDKVNAETTMKLRKEYEDDPTIKATRVIETSVNRMNSVWNNYVKTKGTALEMESKNALDQLLVITFNKALDPGSVVRESEFARTPEGSSLVNKYQGMVERAIKGGVGLNDAERKSLVQTAQQMMEAQNKYKSKIDEFFVREASKIGVDPSRVIRGYGEESIVPKPTTALAPRRAQAPAKGSVVDNIEVIPEGAVVIDEATGQRMKKKGGRLVKM